MRKMIGYEDSTQLQWTELMQAIAFGGLVEVKSLLDRGADLSARDYWSRTPWLLSLQEGDLEKAQLLLSSGAQRSDCGRCGKPPMMYPIENNRVEVLNWLIEEGFDIEATDEFQNTPLIVAAECGATDCVRALLKNGANPVRINNCYDTAIKVASNLEIVRMLVDAGAYIIGSLGYQGERIYNETPVYRLHCDTFKIEKIETTGDKPGWISRHKAYYKEPSKIYITGGKVCVILNEKEEYIENSVDYTFDLTNLNWSLR